jgi:hypothetical protein
MSEPFAKQLYKLMNSHRREVRTDFEVMSGQATERADKLAQLMDLVHDSLQGSVHRREARLWIGFVLSAGIATGSAVFSCREEGRIERLLLERDHNNALITPNGKDYYTINNADKYPCPEYEVTKIDLDAASPPKPTVTFKLPEQQDCKP